MKRIYKLSIALIIMVASSGFAIYGQNANEITVFADQPSADVKSTMWGVFFEDINFAADGGLYAELVKNRSFEFSLPMIGWDLVRDKGDGRSMISFYSPANEANPRYLRLVVNAESGAFGLSNEGFRGMGIKKDLQYNFSVSARISEGSDLKMKIELINSKGEIFS